MYQSTIYSKNLYVHFYFLLLHKNPHVIHTTTNYVKLPKIYRSEAVPK